MSEVKRLKAGIGKWERGKRAELENYNSEDRWQRVDDREQRTED